MWKTVKWEKRKQENQSEDELALFHDNLFSAVSPTGALKFPAIHH